MKERQPTFANMVRWHTYDPHDIDQRFIIPEDIQPSFPRQGMLVTRKPSLIGRVFPSIEPNKHPKPT